MAITVSASGPRVAQPVIDLPGTDGTPGIYPATSGLSVPDDAHDLAERLRPVLMRLGRRMRHENTLGVSNIDTILVHAIRRQPGIAISELADLEGVRRPSMSAHVKRLERLGWIMRMEAAPSDRRRVGLAVTPAGQAMLETVRDRRTDWLAERVQSLTDGERAALAAVVEPLNRLNDTD